MNKQRFSPDDLRVASPCTASWEGMSGDERKRLCALCGLHVHNVAALTRVEVEALVNGADGRLCLRLYRRADGTVITRDCPVGLRAVRRRVARKAGALFAALLAFGSAVFAQNSKRKDDKKSCPVVSTLKVERSAAKDKRGAFGGVVKDTNGGLVEGATVTLTNEATKRKLSTETDDKGEFTFPVEKDGRYTVEVVNVWSAPYKAEHVELKADQTARADVTVTMSEPTVEVTVGVVLVDDGTPIKTTQGTTTINVEVLRNGRPRD